MKDLNGRTLFGITLKEGNVMDKESYKDYFEEIVYDDETLLLKFKEEFEEDFWDEGKPIKYHMFLNFCGNEEFGYSVQLLMLPTLDFICKDIIQELADDYAIPREHITERDIIENEIVPILEGKALDFSIDNDWYTDDMIELLETATAVIPFINRIIGFNLDRAINMIGTTNWDCLKGLLYGSDPIRETMNRYKEATK
jgi:hypothetical protein